MEPLTTLFPPLNGGGEGVGYGYKGKGILIHSITDAKGMPVVATTTPANGDEKQQVLPVLNQIRLANGKRGNPKRRPKILAAEQGYDAKWLRYKLRPKGIRPQIKKRQWKDKKLRGRPMAETVPRYGIIQRNAKITIIITLKSRLSLGFSRRFLSM